MSTMHGKITGVHHVGLPSKVEDWPMLRSYYESLGLQVREVEIPPPPPGSPDYDYIGSGRRLEVHSNGQLFVSFFLGDHPPHVAFTMAPPALPAARAHAAAFHEVDWGHSNRSVFHRDSAGNIIELVTTDPDYHRDPDHDPTLL